jgi:glycosyltransferase involved in cell wall biosynthesis
MKIGIMLRHYEQHGGGVKVYTENLLRELFALETPHEFILIYQNPRLVGTYANGKDIREIAVNIPSVFLWDQLAVPKIEKAESLDLIFNPKYSLPLRAGCRTVFVCHGLDWYVMPSWSKWMDRLNHKHLIPRYAKKADAIIAVSNTARKHLFQYLGVDENRVHTVYHGVDEAYRGKIAGDRLERIRRAYKLPERFFLYVGQIYPPKNFGRLLRAYAKVGPRMGISLVVAGESRWLCKEELKLIEELGISSWVFRPGWVGRESLPSFYSLAEALLLPSLYESFGIPLLEAMATGCPVLTSDRHACPEIVDGAALLVDPEDIGRIARGMQEIATQPSLQQQLREAGKKRASAFSWKKCAYETLQVLERVYGK